MSVTFFIVTNGEIAPVTDHATSNVDFAMSLMRSRLPMGVPLVTVLLQGDGTARLDVFAHWDRQLRKRSAEFRLLHDQCLLLGRASGIVTPGSFNFTFERQGFRDDPDRYQKGRLRVSVLHVDAGIVFPGALLCFRLAGAALTDYCEEADDAETVAEAGPQDDAGRPPVLRLVGRDDPADGQED